MIVQHGMQRYMLSTRWIALPLLLVLYRSLENRLAWMYIRSAFPLQLLKPSRFLRFIMFQEGFHALLNENG